MKKVSVIVPVYNVEAYLPRCLDSLVNQTLKDIEIIVVNDGSPDNSQSIIDAYQKQYPEMIHAYIKENGGLSDARNYGIKKASGEYLAFIDSDDYVEPQTFERMYQKAREADFDVVACHLKYIYEDSDEIKYVSSHLREDITEKEKLKEIIISIYPSACNKIYKRSIFHDDCLFKKGILFEDVEFTHRLISNIKSIGKVDEYLINYTQRSGTITKTPNKKVFDYIDNMNGIIAYYQEKGIFEEYQRVLEYSYVRYLYATFIKQSALLNKSDYNEAVRLAQKNVKEKFPHYRFHAYFYRNGLKGIYLILFNKMIAAMVYQMNH